MADTTSRPVVPDFGQGVGAVGGLRVQVCPRCHALVLYHSWAAHAWWHHSDPGAPSSEGSSRG